MKKQLSLILVAAAAALLLGGCTAASRDNRQAGIYAEQLERGEEVSAEEYSKMVTFYCDALDRTLQEIEPAAKKHAAALESNDADAIKKTADELDKTSARVHHERENLIRLGSGLQRNFEQLPDSVRQRLSDHIIAVTLRFYDFR